MAMGSMVSITFCEELERPIDLTFPFFTRASMSFQVSASFRVKSKSMVPSGRWGKVSLASLGFNANLNEFSVFSISEPIPTYWPMYEVEIKIVGVKVGKGLVYSGFYSGMVGWPKFASDLR